MVKLINDGSDKFCILDPIPTSLIKECVNGLAPPLCSIINTLIQTSLVPSSFKQAVVTLLIKKANATLEYKNYRPVSNLP